MPWNPVNTYSFSPSFLIFVFLICVDGFPDISVYLNKYWFVGFGALISCSESAVYAFYS